MALVAGAAGVRYLLGSGLKSFGLGAGLGGSAAQQAEEPAKPTAAEVRAAGEESGCVGGQWMGWQAGGCTV